MKQVSRAEIEQLTHGEHGQPHRIVGPHPDGDGVTIRSFKPLARTVTAVLANASILLLLVRSERLSWALGPVSAVGRTAFSNYILTSVACKVLFNWGPWKLYGQLEFYQWYLVVLAIWTANLVLSSLWLRVFAFGPLEWLWRSLTYWKRQPLFLRDIPA